MTTGICVISGEICTVATRRPVPPVARVNRPAPAAAPTGATASATTAADRDDVTAARLDTGSEWEVQEAPSYEDEVAGDERRRPDPPHYRDVDAARALLLLQAEQRIGIYLTAAGIMASVLAAVIYGCCYLVRRCRSARAARGGARPRRRRSPPDLRGFEDLPLQDLTVSSTTTDRTLRRPRRQPPRPARLPPAAPGLSCRLGLCPPPRPGRESRWAGGPFPDYVYTGNNVGRPPTPSPPKTPPTGFSTPPETPPLPPPPPPMRLLCD